MTHSSIEPPDHPVPSPALVPSHPQLPGLFAYYEVDEFAAWARMAPHTVRNKISIIRADSRQEGTLLPRFVSLAGRPVFPVALCAAWSAQTTAQSVTPGSAANDDTAAPGKPTKKSKKTTAEAAVAEPAAAQGQPAVKRGRGRPRKPAVVRH